MNYLNNFFLFLTNMDKNSKFLLSMIALIIILLIVIIIISAYSKKKEEEELKKKKQVPTDKNMIQEKLKKLDFQLEDKNTKSIPKEEVKKPVKEDIKPVTKPEPVEEKKVEEDIEIIEVDDDNDIEKIANLIEQSEPKDFNLNEFEKEQEESAIISYDELVKKAGAKKIVYKTKKEEKTKSDEFEQMSMNFDIKEPKKDKKVDSPKTSFTPSKIVSPIYGVQNQEISKVNKNTRVEKYEQISTGDKDMDEDIEFLNKLKKFREELQ